MKFLLRKVDNPINEHIQVQIDPTDLGSVGVLSTTTSSSEGSFNQLLEPLCQP